ncbi:glycoside hydrolase family 16 protein [Flavicella sediminum]|uniref:glycoside hydrolase family 16 protein n=1 Tax=Flavicella sediminum TaxID=2585141 RepID=UPI00111D5B43
MRSVNKYTFLLFFIFVASIACSSNEEIEVTAPDIIPSNLIIAIDIVGQHTGQPNGNGSGQIKVIATATNASAYKIQFENNTSIENTTGIAEHEYTTEGSNSYIVTVFAYSETGNAISQFRKITVLKEGEAGPEETGLVWSDEFDTDGAVDATKWFHQTKIPAGGSWYNGEIQHYTNRIENTNVTNGILNIVAKKETFTDQGHTKQYTSARLNSKFAFKYGKVKIRAKLPTGNGTWPAIWTLGKNITESGGYWANDFGTTGWPACGEIDIMEHWGSNQNFVQSAMHTPSSSGATINHGGQTIATASSEFHIYELDWNSERMIFSVDGNVHYTYNPELKNANTWPYDAEQYLLLNIAIQPSITASFTEDAMEIDYVRVYKQ